MSFTKYYMAKELIIRTEREQFDVYNRLELLNFLQENKKDIDKLKEKIEKMREGLQFYAHDNNWIVDFDNDEATLISEGDVEYLNSYPTGGKLARQVLKEIENDT